MLTFLAKEQLKGKTIEDFYLHYFPHHTSEQVDFFIWEQTPFPFGAETALKMIYEEYKSQLTAKDWVAVNDRLPECSANDFLSTGYTTVETKDSNGVFALSKVTDHHTWEMIAKETGVTHWRVKSL